MTPALLLIALSLVLLYFGADWLVKGSSSLALRLGVSPLITGLTVVAFGTSMPELVVSTKAALAGSPEIAVGNVVGSNIFNIGIILGISALIFPLRVNTQLLRFDMPLLSIITLLFVLMFWGGTFGRIEGILFLVGIIGYVLWLIRLSKKTGAALEAEAPQKIYKHSYYDLLFIVVGLTALVAGASLLVENAIVIARDLGVSESIIGLTIVAAGTSLPELATSLVAALKKNNDIAVGNIVGSNIFNLLAIMGCSALINPIAVGNSSNHLDLLVMLGFTLLLFLHMYTGKTIRRNEGALLILCYGGYLTYLISIS